MSGYKKMYLKLFNKLTDVIIELQQVQQEVEEMYISQGDDTKSSTIEIRKSPNKD